MNTPLTTEALTSIGTVFLFGLIALLVVAWRARSKSWRISTFFLAGRNIGAPLTEHVYWGTSFSLANGLYYFSFLGYYYGLSAIWFQLPWAASVWFLAWQLPQIIKETGRFTIHGFLGDLYGQRIRTLASIVTLTGFLGFFAFEINISLEILGRVVGIEGIVIPLTFIFAIYSAAYCDIGGFAGTARTDYYQNILGVVAVSFIMYCLFRVPHSQIPVENLTLTRMSMSLFDFGTFPTITIFAILCYASTYNIVDMSNWQAIAANSAAKPEQIRSLRIAMVKSTFWMILLPATVGTLFGYVWREVEIGEYERISMLVQQVFPDASYIGGLILGTVILGLAATAMSTTDSYLIASCQTMSWDIRDKQTINQSVNADDIDEEKQYSIIRSSRRRLYWMAIISVSVFLLLRYLLGDQTAFVAQFVLAGLVVSLAPSTLLGLYFRHINYKPIGLVKKLCGASVVFGYFGGMAVFVYFLSLASKEFDVYAWAPLVTFVSSFSLCAAAFLAKSVTKSSNQHSQQESI